MGPVTMNIANQFVFADAPTKDDVSPYQVWLQKVLHFRMYDLDKY